MIRRRSSTKAPRSLRTRVYGACALAFLGLAAVVCLALPRAYEAQVRSAFSDRVLAHARAIAFLDDTVGESSHHAAVASLLSTEGDFVSAAVTTADGTPLERWPDESNTPSAESADAPAVFRLSDGYIAHHPMITAEGERLVVSVRLSSDSLARDLENVRWLFASILLLLSGIFFVLTLYLTRTILQPIEQIGRAAMDLADGEPFVEVPNTGDREIDDLGTFIRKLGENRRVSRVMESPLDVLSRGRKRGGSIGGDLVSKKLAEPDEEC